MENRFLTVSEAARQKEVSRSAVYKAIADGRLSARQILGHVALSKTEVAKWKAKTGSGRKKGQSQSEEAKVKISQGQKLRWKQRKTI
jgi:excisionase family DNA binding protein